MPQTRQSLIFLEKRKMSGRNAGNLGTADRPINFQDCVPVWSCYSFTLILAKTNEPIVKKPLKNFNFRLIAMLNSSRKFMSNILNYDQPNAKK